MGENLALTDAQMSIWLAQMISPDSSGYNIAEYVEFNGHLDTDIFIKAVQSAANDIGLIHSRFVETDNGPRQHFYDHITADVELINLSEHPDGLGAAQLWMSTDTALPSDIHSNQPLYKFAFFTLGDDHFIFYHRYHHILVDGASGALIISEIESEYQRLTTGVADNFTRGSWMEIIAEEEAYKISSRFRRDREYWLAKLEDRPFPVSLSGKIAQSFRLDMAIQVTGWIPSATIERLRTLGLACGASLAQVLTSISSLYCLRFSDRNDIVIGLPASARVRQTTRNTPGMVSNILPLRLRVETSETVEQFLSGVARTMREGLRHQLYREENIYRDLCLTPAKDALYSTVINIFNYQSLTTFADCPASCHNISVGPVNDCQFSFFEGSASSDMRLDLNGNPALHDSNSLAKHLERFLAFLETIAQASPETLVSNLPFLEAAERHQVLHAWNATTTDYPRDACVHQLFEAQAAQTPAAIAVIGPQGQTLTYAQLNARANQLAHHLIARGVGPDALVGLCLERLPELIVAQLAVLKAGAAYLPLDPAYPAERLGFIIADAKVQVLLTRQSLREHLPAFSGIMCLDTEAGIIAARPDDAPASTATPANLAYVIYTSGSTGMPKGVAIEHRNAVNFIAWSKAAFSQERLAQTLFSTSLNFDLAVYETFVPLVAGGTVHIVENALALADRELPVTLINTVPSAIRALIDAGGIPHTVRTINLAGEPLSRALTERLFAETQVDAICNLYGPSETTTYSTGVAMRRGEGFAPHIGRPIANTRIYLLDSHGQPVPIGVPGELYIGGDGVARGYLGRPDLTAQRFVADPFAREAGEADARMYRTGDLGRWREDGNIEFLGRNDDQVKIRGFRIELGEIETVLARHAQVREVAVVARSAAAAGAHADAGPGTDKQLVAYVVATHGEQDLPGGEIPHGQDPGSADAALAARLRQHIRTSLPEHMVPAAFVMLPALPLTPNGKVDRKALPQPVASHAADFGILRDAPTQDILAAVWQELLGIRMVGPDDNFFELGGDSLMALKMSSLLQDRASIHLPVRMIFEFPTLSALSQQIIAQPGEIDGPNVIAITPELFADAVSPATEDRPDMAKIIAKQRSYLDHWQGHRMEPDSLIVTLNENGTRRGLFWCLQGHQELSQFAIHLGPDQPVHGLRSGHLVMEYTWETVSMLAAHYVAEMVKIQPHGDFVIGGNCQGGLITQTVANQLKALGRNVSLLILMEQSTFYEYDGDVALIFGKNSFLNPYKDESQDDPDAIFAHSYHSYTVDFIDGSHGEFFSPPNVESLMQVVRKLLYGNHKAALAIA